MSPATLSDRVKPAPKTSKKRSKGRSRGELSDDGYEDLVKGEEGKFAMKVNNLKVLFLGRRLNVAGYIFFASVAVSF
jgi:hypothetical protein